MGISLKVLVCLCMLSGMIGKALSNPVNDPNLDDSNIDDATKDENTGKETRVVEMIPLSSEGIKIKDGVGIQQKISGDTKTESSGPQIPDAFESTVPEIGVNSDASLTENADPAEFDSAVSQILEHLEKDATHAKILEDYAPKIPQYQIGSDAALPNFESVYFQFPTDSRKPSIQEGDSKSQQEVDLTNGLNVPEAPSTNTEDRAIYGRLYAETIPEISQDTKEKATVDQVSFIDNNNTISEPSTVTETSELQASDPANETIKETLKSERQDYGYGDYYSSAGSDYGTGYDDLYNYGSSNDNYGSSYDNDGSSYDYYGNDLYDGVEGDNYNVGDIDYGPDNYNQGEGDYEIDNYNLGGGNYDLGSQYSNYDGDTGDYGDYLLKTQRELEKKINDTQTEIESLLTQLYL